jgi:hypothetical protein
VDGKYESSQSAEVKHLSSISRDYEQNDRAILGTMNQITKQSEKDEEECYRVQLVSSKDIICKSHKESKVIITPSFKYKITSKMT